jgi:hypothetical protein
VLYLDSATTVQVVTPYRDYSSGKLVHRRNTTDNPAFKEGNQLGGLLTMTVAFLVPESVLTAIRSALLSQGGQEVELTPVLFEFGAGDATGICGHG